MPIIRQIRIEGLNEVTNLTIPVKGRHCIIVGPNGSGKSTALLIIASALGRQWKRLAELRFTKVEFTFADGKTAGLTRAACQSHVTFGGRPERYVRMQKALDDSGLAESFVDIDLRDTQTIAVYSDLLRVPSMELRRFQAFLRSITDVKGGHKEIVQFQAALKAADIPPVIFLPTYRRIELELKQAIEQIPDYYRERFERAVQGTDTDFIVELIRFGMEDVTRTLATFERETKDYARNQFNRMMTSYLKEMANAKALSVRELRSRQVQPQTVDVVLSRIEEGLLSQTEKAKIASVVLELSTGSSGGNPPFNKKWLAHFFIRLMEVNENIEMRERPIRAMVRSLRRYFGSDKEVNYDVEKYHFSISSSGGGELQLSDLSSGEKQLVSILSQLNFTRYPRVNVLIDEPELSLSVPWQFSFLPDIAGTPSCNQIFAVTHSPFIYDNSLASEVIDFVECVER